MGVCCPNGVPNCAVQTPPCGSWTAQFFAQVVAGLGGNPKGHAPGVLAVWCTFEGTGAGWNPLATTWIYGNDTCWNCNAYVKCYASQSDGVAATIATLQHYAQYAPIIHAIQQDLPIQSWACVPGLIAGIHTWGTTGFANHLQALGCTAPPPGPTGCNPPCVPPAVCVNGTCTAAPSASTGSDPALLIVAGTLAAVGAWEWARHRRHAAGVLAPSVAGGFSRRRRR